MVREYKGRCNTVENIHEVFCPRLSYPRPCVCVCDFRLLARVAWEVLVSGLKPILIAHAKKRRMIIVDVTESQT